MLKKSLVIAGFVIASLSSQAQDKHFTKTGKIEFYSKAPMEDIEAKNKTVAAILDTKTGALQFSVLMKGFEFPKALMQEHFNENYVESDKYPKAEFKGTISNNSSINYATDGTYPAQVKGKLTIHGITRDITAPGTVKVENGKIAATSTFNVLVSDYQIKIPAVVKDKISNTIKVTVDCSLEPLK
jgi:polyisoprenoid-binding protein YceI